MWPKIGIRTVKSSTDGVWRLEGWGWISRVRARIIKSTRDMRMGAAKMAINDQRETE